ncbi:MAG: nucleotidyltransferase [Verrucomicrobiae bacterium]|nr:nucleotidyltransferase [Verrucomicrobiae bacterium]
MTPRVPALVVMAAGMGSRYGGLKQIDPVGPGGETILEYSVFDALRAGFGKVVFILRKDIEEAFRAAVGRRFEKRIAVEYAFQSLDDLPKGFATPAGRSKPWGTSQAVLSVRGKVREPFAVINADDFYGAASFKTLAKDLETAREGRLAEGAMVGYVLRNTLSDHGPVARGVCREDAEGCLLDVTERTKIERAGNDARFVDDQGEWHALSGDSVVSMNFWGFTSAIFPLFEEEFVHFLRKNADDPKAEFYIPTPVQRLIATQRLRVRVLRSGAPWFGITYREDKPRVVESIRRLVEDGEYPPRLGPV